MEGYFIRLGFWAGFGKAMALGIFLGAIAIALADTSLVTPFSLLCGIVLWAAGSCIWALDKSAEAKRYWHSHAQSLDQVDGPPTGDRR